MSLTDRFIASLEAPQAGQKTYLDKSIKGFGVRISQGGSKAFVLVHGKERQRITIGHYPIITLAQARAEAKKILAETTLGRQLDAMSYEEALDLYCRHHLAFKSKAHRIEAERLLRRHFGFKTLEQIDRKAVVPILDDLTSRAAAPKSLSQLERGSGLHTKQPPAPPESRRANHETRQGPH